MNSGSTEYRRAGTPEGGDAPRCPHCGWSDVRPAMNLNAMNSMLRALSIRTYRCRSCGKRFHLFQRKTQAAG